jgi:hypothetical protein
MKELLNLLPPPAIPFPNIQINWDVKEKELGILFPEDYKCYIETYGFGGISDDIFVLHPLGNTLNVNIFLFNKYFQNQYDKLQVIKQIREEKLFCWGAGLTGGAYFFWKFDPLKPYVVSFDMRGVGREDYPGISMVEFIYGVLTNTLICGAVTANIDYKPVFKSIITKDFDEI